MFRRRRAASNPPASTTPTPSAALAASQAFLNNRASSASLSSAAAAAALRSHTTSPVPIGEIQTRRMQRRSSNASNTSAAGRPPSAMQRQNSTGSMTERTFRSPSPGRMNRVGSPVESAPPVPALPKDIPAVPPRSSKRASSLDPPPTRVVSPPPTRPGGRGVSVDRGTRAPPTKSSTARVTSLSNVPEAEREGSQRNVNFSRPMSQGSSPTTPNRSGHSGWYASPVVSDQKPRESLAVQPAATNGLPADERSSIQQSIQSAAEKPVTNKKKKVATGVQGSHLSSGSMASQPTGTTLVYDPHSRMMRPVSPEPAPVQIAVTSNTVDLARSISPAQDSSRTRPPLTKQPSTVHEDKELEEKEDQTPVTSAGRKLQASSAMTPQEHTRAASLTVTPANGYMKETPRVRSASLDISRSGHGVGRGGRPQSVSPARAAHFSNAPAQLLNGFKHQPPPRSLSPAKSALKHSPSSSVRTASPAANAVGDSRSTSRDMSGGRKSEDSTTVTPKKKKKSVRVSFDEPPPPPPAQVAAPGSSTGSPIATGSPTRTKLPEFQDGTMGPTPALPSFGSIRRNKSRDDEPLATERVAVTDSSSTATPVSTLGPSNDHVVGGILAQHFSSKNATPNKEGDYQSQHVPTPASHAPGFGAIPAEGSGYETADSVYSQEEDDPKIEEKGGTYLSYGPVSTSAVEGVVQQHSSLLDNSSHDIPLKRTDLFVPSIAVLPATPAAGEDSHKEMMDTVDGFPEPSVEAIAQHSYKDRVAEHHATDPTPSMVGISEPSPADASPPAHPVTSAVHVTSAETDPRSTENEESEDNDSVYSDAAEDLSDMEGGGFASLDAIVESPMRETVPGPAISTPPGSPSMVAASRSGRLSNWMPDQVNETPSTVAISDWDQTKAYWSGLSEQRRQQIEREAMSDTETPTRPKAAKAAVPAVPALPTEPTETRKPKMKKATAPRPDQSSAQAQSRPATDPSGPPRQPAQRGVPAMKKSMRGPPGAAGAPAAPIPTSETHMRQSMRNSGTMPTSMRGSGTMPTSMRSSGAMPPSMRGDGPVVNRVSSPPPEPRGTLQKKHIPMWAGMNVRPAPSSGIPVSRFASKPDPKPVAQPKPSVMPPLKRTGSDASDSSFRRQKTSTTVGEGGRYSMRRSMRSSSQPPAAPAARPMSPQVRAIPPPQADGSRYTMKASLRSSSQGPAPPSLRPSSPPASTKGRRFSIRSLSPSPSFLGRQKQTPGRASLDSAVATLRPADTAPSQGRTSFSGFARPLREEPKPAPPKSSSRFKSRFDDSSDSEDGAPRFRSRFVDSDDEDLSSPALPTDLTPVRGIPRRPGEEDGDSTDLSGEESDAGLRSPPVPSTRAVNSAAAPAPLTNGKPQGAALAAGSLRGNAPDQPADLPNGLPGNKDKPKRGLFGMGRRRASSNTVATLNTPGRPATPAKAERILGSFDSPRSPRLQRRNTPQGFQRAQPDAWPPPPGSQQGDAAGRRPQTSDGAPAASLRGTMRPDMGKRRSTGPEGLEGKVGRPVVVGRSGKKKKFPMLRRVFGLRD